MAKEKITLVGWLKKNWFKIMLTGILPDIDVEPERYKHYFINEIPERFHDKVDVRRFGIGERVVPQPYTQAIFEKTQAWMHARKLFDPAADDGVSYEQAVDS